MDSKQKQMEPVERVAKRLSTRAGDEMLSRVRTSQIHMAERSKIEDSLASPSETLSSHLTSRGI